MVTPPRPRLHAIGAIIALLAIAVIAVGMFTLRPESTGASFASGHDHGSESVGREHGSEAADHGHGSEATDHEPSISVTPAEQQRADDLVASTEVALAAYADVAAADAAGYRWIGDGQGDGEYRHYIEGDYLLDDTVLDPSHVESLVYRERADGSLELVSGMFILPPGSGLDDVPDVAGDLTPWHEHTNLCWSGRGEIVGTNDSGSCPEGSYNFTTPPMLHVWVVDNRDGPFAAIDENGIVSATHH